MPDQPGGATPPGTQANLKYAAPNEAELANLRFTRKQVLKSEETLPHTRTEFDERMSTKGAEFDKQIRERKAAQEELATALAKGEPIYGIAKLPAFINSAIAMLKPEDFAKRGAALYTTYQMEAWRSICPSRGS